MLSGLWTIPPLFLEAALGLRRLVGLLGSEVGKIEKDLFSPFVASTMGETQEGSKWRATMRNGC